MSHVALASVFVSAILVCQFVFVYILARNNIEL